MTTQNTQIEQSKTALDLYIEAYEGGIIETEELKGFSNIFEATEALREQKGLSKSKFTSAIQSCPTAMKNISRGNGKLTKKQAEALASLFCGTWEEWVALSAKKTYK